MIKKFLSGAILGLILFEPSSAFQQIPTVSVAQTANCNIGWDQVGPSLVDVQAYNYEAFVDGAATAILAPTTCSGTASPFLCKTPLPIKSVGTHTVSIKNSMVLNDGTILSGGVSATFTYRVVNPPIAPANLRLILN